MDGKKSLVNLATKFLGKLIAQMGPHLETPESMKFIALTDYSEGRFDGKPLMFSDNQHQ